MTHSYRIGIDVGGTFTDLYLFEEAKGSIVRHKLPSTPDNPYEAPIRGLVEILDKASAPRSEVRFIGLGTTVATNTLLERKGAKTGLITTRGFRDLLELARQKRPRVYDLFVRKPEPLVSREYRLEVDERMEANGTVLRDLDTASVVRTLNQLLAGGVESIAICFLNSYANAAHERRAKELLRQHWPDGFVTASEEILPEFREYERLSTTVLNAYLMPRMKRYLDRFSHEVQKLGFKKEPLVMGSGGGVVSPALASQRPIDTPFSGPSGGVSGAAYLASLLEVPDIVTFDMGGTSTDVCLIKGYRPEITQARTLDGLPVKSTALDVHTVGAGGSSVAWIDDGGLLCVGPHSVGAKPGPACYGIGGTEPTVTDANVVLGRLNPDYLLGGAVAIDSRRSNAAIEDKIGRRKGLDVYHAAAAILAVSNVNIAQAIRFVSVERGLDPKEFLLVAFGGAGPLHAAAVARDLGMSVLIPESPGVLCAMGVLTKDIQIDLSQTRLVRDSSSGTEGIVEALYADLERRATATLRQGGLDGGALRFERSVDARYVGQNFEIPIIVPDGTPRGGVLISLRDRFHDAHKRLYGYHHPGKEVELVTFRIKASLPVARPKIKKTTPAQGMPPPSSRGRRKVFFEREGGFVDCPIYERAVLMPAHVVSGPAIVEQMDTTTVIPPDFTAHVDEFLNLRLDRNP